MGPQVARGAREAGLGSERGRRRYANGNGNGNGEQSRGRGALFVLLMAGLVLVGIVAIGVPAASGAFSGWARSLAEDNPEALRLPFVADIVRGQIADQLDDPAGTDATPVRFEVPSGANAREIGRTLVQQGFLKDELPFDYLVVTGNVSGKLQAGTYELHKAMSPQDIVAELQKAPIQTLSIALREGLRLEQITAYLQTVGLETDIEEFYRIASEPPAELRADYPFLETLPEGASLEGFLGSGTFEVYGSVTAEEIVRLLLDQWGEQAGDAPERAEAAGKSLYEVVTLASIVEREAAVEEERPLIASVYLNRVTKLDPPLLNADPTVFYAYDTAQLRTMDIEEWPSYAFWTVPTTPLSQLEVPEDLRGFQTYQVRGMIPGPICTPTRASIDAAIDPPTDDDYLYFVLIPDGSRKHAFAKTYNEHLANLERYGY
jgi:UPF0755 protein